MTLKALASKLHTSEQALAGMLQMLVQRGQVEEVSGGDCKGSCGCVNATTYAYRWLDKTPVTPLNVMSINT